MGELYGILVIFTACCGIISGSSDINVIGQRTLIRLRKEINENLTQGERRGVGGMTTLTFDTCAGDWCDPGHEPYPNIVAAMTGYNLLSGNLYSPGIEQDHGFETDYIFSPVVLDEDHRYALHSGITVRKVRKCDMTSKKTIIYNAEGYRNATVETSGITREFSTNPPIEVTGNIGETELQSEIKSIAEVSTEGSKITQKNEEFFKSDGGIVTITDATCSEYRMQLSYSNPPRFSATFLRAVKKLNRHKDSADIKEVFFRFMDRFGTHFLLSATMGARLAIQRRYTRNEYRKTNINDINRCDRTRLAANMVAGVTRTSEQCSTFKNTNLDREGSNIGREEVTSYGSKPAEKLEDWAQQDFVAPRPIKMKLSPILHLFKYEFVKHPDDIQLSDGERIDYVGIYNKVYPFHKEYCIDKLGREICKVDESVVCGINDECDPKTKVCKQNPGASPRTVTCEDAPEN